MSGEGHVDRTCAHEWSPWHYFRTRAARTRACQRCFQVEYQTLPATTPGGLS